MKAQLSHLEQLHKMQACMVWGYMTDHNPSEVVKPEYFAVGQMYPNDIILVCATDDSGAPRWCVLRVVSASKEEVVTENMGDRFAADAPFFFNKKGQDHERS